MKSLYATLMMSEPDPATLLARCKVFLARRPLLEHAGNP
jgi:hypothetical protein